MPREFWREAVDRVAAEAPDTLLLAEAFWLLEGYFVRTLGMHRVYNSAFMNMLRDERNAEYRKLIRETLDFDPQILRRYVNFMSNPDERTSIDQFGSGDKYFGVATMMATLPGLPMFGHGQIEGFAEKYGMEFRRPRWEEQADEELVWRHERQIFPLLHRRRIFAEADHFVLYDLLTPEGGVDENVLAYSNRSGDERSLVIYHNRQADTRGRLCTGPSDGRSLAEALALPSDSDAFVVFRDAVGGLEYIRASSELREQGLYAELGAYGLQVFVDFRGIRGERCRELCDALGGRGVASVDDALAELEPAPVSTPDEAISPPPVREATRRRWFIRWLPLGLLAAALLALAGVDLYHVASSRPPDELRLLDVAELRFEPQDRLVDLRDRNEAVVGVPVDPVHELAEGWDAATRDGVASLAERAVLTLRLPAGGHRTLFLQGHRDRNQPARVRLLVEVNGVECGLFLLERRYRLYRLELPEGLVTAGSNRIELSLLRKRGERQLAIGRSLVLRRLALAMGTDADFKAIMRQRSPKLDLDSSTLTIRTPGRLVFRFDVPTAGSFLSFDYRIRSMRAETEFRVGLGRWFVDLAAADLMNDKRLSIIGGETRRQFFYMGHHVGPSVLWFDTSREAADAQIEILDPRLTTTRPRRRPN
jgi:hypothetical protein